MRSWFNRAATTIRLLRPDLEFWPELEQRYQNDTAVARARHLRRVSALGAVVYTIVAVALNLFVVMDPVWPQVAVQLLLTPAIGLLIHWRWFRPGTPDNTREAAAFLSGLVYTMSVILAVYFDTPKAAAQNLVLIALPVNFMLIFVQLRLRVAMLFVAVCLLLHTAFALARSDVPLQGEVFAIAYLAALCIPTLFAVYSMEHGARSIYLHGVQQRQFIEHLAAERGALAELSTTDPLTGTANRRRLDAELQKFCKPQATGGALLLIDIDEFKSFNDRHGHLVGDICLREMAACLAAQIRRCDLLARFGGEEFAVLVPGVDGVEAVDAAERLRRTIEGHSFSANGQTLQMTVSIGVSRTACSRDPAALISLADAALYAAKDAGRNRVCTAWGEPYAVAA